jgi:hypothetical protein
MRPRDLRRIGVIGAAALAATLALAGPISAAPGNNGTVKIDGLAFDEHPNNEPHVGCQFQIDFYGFDAGGRTADIEFRLVPPTGSEALITDQVQFTGPTETDLPPYVISVNGLDPHPVQGYHVKLTVHVDGARGADTKHKTFWVTECESTDPPPDPPGGDQDEY